MYVYDYAYQTKETLDGERDHLLPSAVRDTCTCGIMGRPITVFSDSHSEDALRVCSGHVELKKQGACF